MMRPVNRNHAEEIFGEFTAEICRHMFPRPASQISETLDFIDRSRANMAAGEELVVSVFSRVDGTLLGGAGMHDLPSGKPEAGIWIKQAAHGHGYGLEAVRGLVGSVAQSPAVQEIRYPVMIENWPSRRIPERLGGTITRHFQKANASGVLRDLIEYVIPVGRTPGP